MSIARHSRTKQLSSTTRPPTVELGFPDNDAEPLPGVTPDGTSHCPTCTCAQFDPRTSRMLDLVVDLHEALGTATEQVGTMRAVLEAEVLP